MTSAVGTSIPRTCVSIDLETTGLQSETDEIVEIGAVLFRGEQVLDTFHVLVNPGKPIPRFVSLLTGIADADVKDAQPFAEIAVPLREFLADHAVVGQNVSFDIGFLATKGIHPVGPVFDTRNLSRMLRPDVADHGLAALVSAFEIVNESPHRALADAEATRRVFLALWDQMCGLQRETLAAARSLFDRVGQGWPEGMLFDDVAKLRALPPSINNRAVSAAIDRLKALDVQRDAPRASRPIEAARSADMVGAMFAPGGAVAATLEGYEPRGQQRKMATTVARALSGGGTFLIEAPPGTGKTLAYLIPALEFARASQHPVVIATSTRGLQEQLANKDLPVALRALGVDAQELSVAVLKGRGNYLCLSRLAASTDRVDLSAEEAAFFTRILVWLESTERGDSGELSLSEPETVIWRSLSAGGDDEHGACAFQRQGVCFPARARGDAQAASLVITNHALVLADSARDMGVLAHVKHLVIDEAHHIEREATDQFGRRVTRRDLDDVVASLGGRDGQPRFMPTVLAQATLANPQSVRQIRDQGEAIGRIAQGLPQQSRDLFGRLTAMVSKQAEATDFPTSTLRVTAAVRKGDQWGFVHDVWAELDAGLSEMIRAIGSLRSMIADAIRPYELRVIDDLSRRTTEVRIVLGLTISEPGSGGIVWVSGSPDSRSGVALDWAPLTTAPLLQASLFGDKETVVLTSGTLATGGDFRHVRTRLGVESAEELLLDSPFDVGSASAVFVPDDMPSPDSSSYRRAVEQCIAQLASMAEGGVLVLFTSYSALRQAYSFLRPALESQGVTVLGQGIDGPPARLADIQRRTPRSVILGASTFWEGVDLAGGALEILVIPRLPFAVPSDPIVAARSETYSDPFSEFTVPESLLRFRQGIGRLIRSGRDQGAIVLLDSRILTRSYGAKFIHALPSGTLNTPSLAHLPEAVINWLYGRTKRSE